MEQQKRLFYQNRAENRLLLATTNELANLRFLYATKYRNDN